MRNIHILPLFLVLISLASCQSMNEDTIDQLSQSLILDGTIHNGFISLNLEKCVFSVYIPTDKRLEVSEDCPWLSLIKDNKQGYIYSFDVDECTENKREGLIHFREKSSATEYSVSVYQSSDEILVLSPRNVSIAQSGGNIDCITKDNVSLSLMDPEDETWISFNCVSNHEFNIKIKEGYAMNRSARIAISQACSDYTDTLTIIQARESAMSGSLDMDISADDSSFVLELIDRDSYSVFVDDGTSWITPDISGKPYSFFASHNPYDFDRKGYIHVKSLELDCESLVAVTQHSSGDIVSDWRSATYRISVDGLASVEGSTPEWLTIEKGTDGATLILKLATNNTCFERQGSIVVKDVFNRTQTKNIVQRGYTIDEERLAGLEHKNLVSSDEHVVVLPCTGTDSHKFDIPSGMKFTLEPLGDDSWLNYSLLSGTGNTVMLTAPANEGFPNFLPLLIISEQSHCYDLVYIIQKGKQSLFGGDTEKSCSEYLLTDLEGSLPIEFDHTLVEYKSFERTPWLQLTADGNSIKYSCQDTDEDQRIVLCFSDSSNWHSDYYIVRKESAFKNFKTYSAHIGVDGGSFSIPNTNKYQVRIEYPLPSTGTEWVSSSKLPDGTASFIVQPNNTGNEIRYALLKFYNSAGDFRQVILYQDTVPASKPDKPRISHCESYISTKQNGLPIGIVDLVYFLESTATVIHDNLIASGKYHIEVPDDCSSWISVKDYGDGSYDINVTKDTGRSRLGSIIAIDDTSGESFTTHILQRTPVDYVFNYAFVIGNKLSCPNWTVDISRNDVDILVIKGNDWTSVSPAETDNSIPISWKANDRLFGRYSIVAAIDKNTSEYVDYYVVLQTGAMPYRISRSAAINRNNPICSVYFPRNWNYLLEIKDDYSVLSEDAGGYKDAMHKLIFQPSTNPLGEEYMYMRAFDGELIYAFRVSEEDNSTFMINNDHGYIRYLP